MRFATQNLKSYNFYCKVPQVLINEINARSQSFNNSKINNLFYVVHLSKEFN